MLQRRKIKLISNHGHVKKRCGDELIVQDSGLMQVQAARPRENRHGAGVDAHGFVALAVLVSQCAAEGGQYVVDAARGVGPEIRGGVFEVQHHAGSPGIQHFYHEVRVIRWTGHLIALVGAPTGQLDAPGLHGAHAGR